MDFGGEFGAIQSGKAFRHPVVCLCHVGFRTSALLVYLFGGMFSSSFIGIFVSVVLLLSIDFWTVKNITGRILVGLRWWNYINDDGESSWVFESRSNGGAGDSGAADSNNPANSQLSQTEVRFFWITLVAAPFFWVILFFTAFFRFKFQWLVLDTIGLALSGSNMLGYLRCRMGSKAGGSGGSISGMANAYLQKSMMSSVMSAVSSRFSSGSQAAANTSSASNQNLFSAQNVI